LIEESELTDAHAAVDMSQTLQQSLKNLNVALLHGKMRTQEKEAIMRAFQAGDIQVLVATTVIEVGIDVKNASLMIIENAERLGLAQLHQLRGRVGRGTVQSYCVLLYDPPLSPVSEARLRVMRETQDGFKIAEEDLVLRGPGEVFGTQQTGEWALQVADLLRDQHHLHTVNTLAVQLVQEQGEIAESLVERWLGKKKIYREI
jgi:ATP-dependent DNA helicase RecG